VKVGKPNNCVYLFARKKSSCEIEVKNCDKLWCYFDLLSKRFVNKLLAMNSFNLIFDKLVSHQYYSQDVLYILSRYKDLSEQGKFSDLSINQL
jgi:hypothetical protein